MTQPNPTDKDELREAIADTCRTGHYGIAETKVVNNLLQLFDHYADQRVKEARINELESVDPAAWYQYDDESRVTVEVRIATLKESKDE